MPSGSAGQAPSPVDPFLQPGRYFTPWQICAAALIGSAVAGGYFMSCDHALFGRPTKVKSALLWGVLITAALVAVALSLRMGRSGTLVGLAVAGFYRWHAKDTFG